MIQLPTQRALQTLHPLEETAHSRVYTLLFRLYVVQIQTRIYGDKRKNNGFSWKNTLTRKGHEARSLGCWKCSGAGYGRICVYKIH